MNKRVMLVDDSDTVLMSVESVLSKYKLDIAKAMDGTEALQKVVAFRPDLIITDLNMPQMDGISLIRELRKMAQFRFTPILLLTTESQEEKRILAREAGATGWLTKPISPANLQAVLQKVLPGVVV